MPRPSRVSAAITVTDDADIVGRAHRIVLPGVGSFADCMAGFARVPGLIEALEEARADGDLPFLGICVGMQLMAERRLEHGGSRASAGSKEVSGSTRPTGLKIPHMGWTDAGGASVRTIRCLPPSRRARTPISSMLPLRLRLSCDRTGGAHRIWRPACRGRARAR